jgi:ribosomal-protein-alanine N-acetyltransferase
MASDCRIRPATLAEVPALAAIERACFSDPWSPEGIAEVFQYGTSIVLAGECKGATVGYLMARVSGEEGEILNLAVLPGYRRKGVAKGLLAEAIRQLIAAGVREAYLEVRESNTAALALYATGGFRPVGVRPHYYRNPLEDALVLRASLPAVR